MNKFKRFPLICLIFFAVAAGCTTPPEVPMVPPEEPPQVQPAVVEPVTVPEEPRSQAPLSGPEWQLRHLYGRNRVPNTMETPIYLQFTETEVFGFTGVNRITGTFTLRGDEGLHFGTLASTKMAGPNLTFEQHLHENLALVRGYYITGDTYEESTLVLFGGHGREEIILAEFTPATP